MIEQADYILLTGGKNNCGDFLIKHRAKELLRAYRENRRFLDWNAWEPLNEEQLSIVNNSKALILTGGPAIQPMMYPNVYPLVKDLEKITVPIICFGLGAKLKTTLLETIPNLALSKKSCNLLSKVNNNGYKSSVRDFATLRLLESLGLENYVTTGCPAFFETYSKPGISSRNKQNVTFSTGVYFADNKAIERQMKDIILELNGHEKVSIIVAFHHSLEQKYLATHNANAKLLKKQIELAEWLAVENINFQDISGNEQTMLSLYADSDFHIGYRVHAHILMSSWGKPSILISEDGRSTALQEVISGTTIDAFKNNSLPAVLKRLTRNKFEIFIRHPDTNIPAHVIKAYERIQSDRDRTTERVSSLICVQKGVMEEFLEQLP